MPGWTSSSRAGWRPTVTVSGSTSASNGLQGFSGHADRQGLLDWAGAMEKKPAHTFLVHGETESAQALAENLNTQFLMRVDVPELGESFKVQL